MNDRPWSVYLRRMGSSVYAPILVFDITNQGLIWANCCNQPLQYTDGDGLFDFKQVNAEQIIRLEGTSLMSVVLFCDTHRAVLQGVARIH